MLSANIYNCGVPSEMVEASIEGLRMVEYGVKPNIVDLPGIPGVPPRVRVTTEHIETRTLNPDIDAHLFLTHRLLAREDDTNSKFIMGRAGYLSGVGIVTCSDKVMEDEWDVVTTSAHEAGHFTGFDIDGWTDEPDSEHCVDNGCILSKRNSDDQYSFCACCRRDIDRFLGVHVDLLRETRRSLGFVTLHRPDNESILNARERA